MPSPQKCSQRNKLYPNLATDLAVDRFTSCHNTRLNTMKTVSNLLTIYNLLRNTVLLPDSVLNIDETWTRVRIKFKGDKSKIGKYFKKYVRGIINKIQKVSYFLYGNDENDSWGSRPIEEFLDNFQGFLQLDDYNVYRHLTKNKPF